MDRVRPMLEPAMTYSGGTHEWEDIVAGVVSTKMQLWANERGAAVTEIIAFPRKQVLNVFLAGGEMDQVLEMLESAREWGKAQGCSAISMSGRRGWLRVLNRHGWNEQFTTMSSELL